MQKEEETLYKILTVKTTANQKDIKFAYYKMAKEHHPDFLQNASEKDKNASAERFKKIVKAYEVLSNPIAR